MEHGPMRLFKVTCTTDLVVAEKSRELAERYVANTQEWIDYKIPDVTGNNG